MYTFWNKTKNYLMLVYSNKLNSDFKIATVLAVSHKPETVGPHALTHACQIWDASRHPRQRRRLPYDWSD